MLTEVLTCVSRECVGKFGECCRPQLRVKIRSLAAESRIIRHEQRKYPGTSNTFGSLYRHRTWDVRREARAALLAYAYLRGRPYKSVEPYAHKAGPPDRLRIGQLVKKYGKANAADGLPEWFAVV